MGIIFSRFKVSNIVNAINISHNGRSSGISITSSLIQPVHQLNDYYKNRIEPQNRQKNTPVCLCSRDSNHLVVTMSLFWKLIEALVHIMTFYKYFYTLLFVLRKNLSELFSLLIK